MFDIINFLSENSITYYTEGKNCQKGWANISCPECNDDSNHGGFNISKGYYNCWKCGKHSLEKIISKLLHCSIYEAKRIIKEYDVSFVYKSIINKNKRKLAEKIKLPGKELKKMHRRYLRKRNFDPDYLIEKYNIKGTGIVGDWNYRIIIPIYYKNRLVAYQGRDVTNKQAIRYKTSSIEESLINPKNILYNFDNCKQDIICVVEGAFDVWRMGDNFAATLGTSLTKPQLRLLQNYKKVVFLFDQEPEAVKKAEQACAELSIFGIDTYVIYLESGDPADMDEWESNNIKKEILYV
jgi:DNA primase